MLMSDFISAAGSAAAAAEIRKRVAGITGGHVVSTLAADIRKRVEDASSTISPSVPLPFVPIIPPPTHHHGFAVGDSTELGDNALTVVEKINAAFKTLFEHISGSASAPSAPAADLSDLASKVAAHGDVLATLKEEITKLEALLNRAINAFIDHKPTGAPNDPNKNPPAV
jgi:hypothetical protein